VAIGACSFYVTINLLNDPNVHSWLTGFLIDHFDIQLPKQTTQEVECEQSESKKFNTLAHEFPWNGITLPKSLNLALEHFANSLIED
jgi:hypothetical protein